MVDVRYIRSGGTDSSRLKGYDGYDRTLNSHGKTRVADWGISEPLLVSRQIGQGAGDIRIDTRSHAYDI